MQEVASNPQRVIENRESFFGRIEPYFAPSVLLDVQLAYLMAKYGHRAQFRKEIDIDGARIRYFEHVRRVAIVLLDEAKCIRPDMVIAALLHDAIEDTKDLTPAMIEHSFGREVVTIVKVLSKVPKDGYIERFNNCGDWRPYVIKACDRLDNLRSLNQPTITVEFRHRQVAETREKYYPLFDRMVTLVTADCRERAMSLRDMVRQETDRQATLLEMNK